MDERWLLEHRDFVAQSAPARPPKILDLGCGVGRDAVLLSEFGSVVAADVNEKWLAECNVRAPAARTICLNLEKPLPFDDGEFDFILASLSLHYFPWADTQRSVAQMLRCLTPTGRAIVRLNSVKDVHYGANSTDEIEPNFYWVGNQMKRFFNESDARALFEDWRIRACEEKQIHRYAKPKVIWELLLDVS